MKEVIVHPLPSLTTEIHEVDIPVPESDQVVIKVVVAGSNVKGKYQVYQFLASKDTCLPWTKLIYNQTGLVLPLKRSLSTAETILLALCMHLAKKPKPQENSTLRIESSFPSNVDSWRCICRICCCTTAHGIQDTQ